MDPNELRERTRSEHGAVEACMPLMQETLTRELYVTVLRCLYSIVNDWETWAAQHVPTSLLPLLAARKRSPLLLEDLRFFGAHTDQQPSAVPDALDGLCSTGPSSSAGAANFLGAMYVIEGSTLGGQYIARHVEELLGLQPGEGDAYFRGYGDRTGSMWTEFKQHLLDIDDTEADRAVAAAKVMFGAFGDSLRGSLSLQDAEKTSR